MAQSGAGDLRSAVVLALLGMLLYLPFVRGHFSGSDEYGVYQVTAAIYERGALSVEKTHHVHEGRNGKRYSTFGIGQSLAALPFLGAAIALRFALRQLADGVDDLLAEEFLALAQELTWAPIRNGVIFAVGGGVFVVLGGGLARWGDRN